MSPVGRLDIDVSTKESRRARKEAEDRELKAARLEALRADWAKAHGARPVAELLCSETGPAHDGLGTHVHARHDTRLVFFVDETTGQWLGRAS